MGADYLEHLLFSEKHLQVNIIINQPWSCSLEVDS